ncbi:hypothetical protein GBM02_04170 [Yersinia pseudotuberculosis]|nr:hypothetical protein [Yersinia pseudotuberculosis]
MLSLFVFYQFVRFTFFILLHHRGVGVEFIVIFHAAIFYNPLKFKLIVIFLLVSLGITLSH